MRRKGAKRKCAEEPTTSKHEEEKKEHARPKRAIVTSELIPCCRKPLYDIEKKTMSVSLPQDVILFHVIMRVPPKSAVRFKCVSKQWNSFLTSDRFREMHNDHNLLKDGVYPRLGDQNLFFLSGDAKTFYTIECESAPDKAPCRRPLPKFRARPPDAIYILTSYHGLVCLRIENNVNNIKENEPMELDIILWNPVTTEYKRLSRPSNPDHLECYTNSGYGLYYSSDEDDYKLLVVVTDFDNVYIYSLKSDSWRKLDMEIFFQVWAWRPCFCLSKYVYFLSDSDTLKGSMRFDTKTMIFHEIKTPPVRLHLVRTSITVQKGSIYFCAMYYICIELWKYSADDDIWSMKDQAKVQYTHITQFVYGKKVKGLWK